jgi:hypothetical protein
MKRTQTSSDTKWLINELAAKRGELEHVDASLRRLVARRNHLLQLCAALERVVDRFAAVPLAEVAPVVHVHGRYGERGALRGWLRRTLQAVYPAALGTSALVDGAIAAFDLQFDSSRDRYRFTTDNLGSALRRLAAAGEIERLHDPCKGSNVPGAWRWRRNQPSLDALRSSQALE